MIEIVERGGGGCGSGCVEGGGGGGGGGEGRRRGGCILGVRFFFNIVSNALRAFLDNGGLSSRKASGDE